jgi:hypothetical protein
MFAFLRRRLRFIRYHSATRTVTGWTRAMEWALVLSLVLAFPAAWMMDRLISRPADELALQGRLAAREGGQVEATILDDRGSNVSWRDGAPLGTFTIDLGSRAHGWPRITSVREQPPTISVDLFSDAPLQGSLRQAEGEDERIMQAIHVAVERGQPPEVIERFRVAQTSVEWNPWSFLAGALLLWVMLYFLAAAVIQSARFAALYARHRRQARAAEMASRGLCPSCGYETRGTEFRDRCPECGELVW